MKLCIGCNVSKDDTCFNKNQSRCGDCQKIYNKNYRIKNKLLLSKKASKKYKKNKDDVLANKKKYYIENRDKILDKAKAYRDENKGKTNEYQREYRENNKDKIVMYNKKYYMKNRKDILAANKRRNAKLLKDNINYKLSCILRVRLNKALKNNYKAGSAVSDLGCTIGELKKHLESMFCVNKTTGDMMSWNNYGVSGWHIDHIKPLSSFNLNDRKQFLEACHYTNLQPLWAEDNLKKGSSDGE